MKTTYYDVLKVLKTAPPEVIKASYKALSQKYHPDRNMSNFETANENMRRLNEAYEVLIDEKRRADYNYLIESYINSDNASNEINKTDDIILENETLHRSASKKLKGFIIEASTTANRLTIIIHYLIGIIYFLILIWLNLPGEFIEKKTILSFENFFIICGILLWYCLLNEEGIAYRNHYEKRPLAIGSLLIWTDILLIGSIIGGVGEYMKGESVFDLEALIIFLLWLIPIIIFESTRITFKWLLRKNG